MTNGLRNLHQSYLSVIIGIFCGSILFFSGIHVSSAQENRVVIYTSSADYALSYAIEELDKRFPDYEIIVEYFPTGQHAARLKAEGLSTPCDISGHLEYAYLELLEELFAPFPEYDFSIFTEDAIVSSKKYFPRYRNGGAIIVNPDVLKKHNLPIPTSYADLLKPEYKNLISMPNPKTSGTGYIFLKSLINAWGEDEAFDYFDALSENVLQFTSAGAGPVNALVQGEVAIGLGMTTHASLAIERGSNLQILFFEEGSPYNLYGYGVIKGKEKRKAVMDVLDFIYSKLNYELVGKFSPEKIFKDKDFPIKHVPTPIPYADMSNDGPEEKQRLLAKWAY